MYCIMFCVRTQIFKNSYSWSENLDDNEDTTNFEHQRALFLR